jgi:hypothetical protein
MATFRELQVSGQAPTPDLVKRTLRSYAEHGTVIDGPVVIEVLSRTSLTEEDMEELCRYAELGSRTQRRRCRIPEVRAQNAKEYEKVVQHLRSSQMN